MDRPRIIIHNLISLDGRLDGFPAEAGLYYELAARQSSAARLGAGLCGFRANKPRSCPWFTYSS
jgi:hypothetical protein